MFQSENKTLAKDIFKQGNSHQHKETFKKGIAIHYIANLFQRFHKNSLNNNDLTSESILLLNYLNVFFFSVNFKSKQSFKYFESVSIYKDRETGMDRKFFFWVRTPLLRFELFILTNHSAVQTLFKLFLSNNAQVGSKRMQKPHSQKAFSISLLPLPVRRPWFPKAFSGHKPCF